jgi:PBP1b-binding outer membrane lipoprotein LpoB
MRHLFIVITLGLVALFLAGCATETSRVEMDYGTSHKLAKFNQTLNPEGEKNLEPVTGIDAQAADKIVEKYQKSFEKPLPASPTFSISAPGVTMK